MIDLKKLKELVDLMKEHDLSEIDLRDGDETVTLKRPMAAPTPPAHYAPPPPAPAPAPPAAPAANAPSAPAVDDGLEAIESPMVGTFYSASNPDSPPFVKVGDSVGPDTVVCLIEAMKVFSEVKAEKSGVVEKILVKNADAVEFGQPLLLIRPA
ncbi:MAG: acetyl-CoA carboxylase biotin carboxyl carrier protein [Phycisphaerales bacterium]